MKDLQTFAASEYARLAEKAAIEVANCPALRDRLEANLRAWLAVLVRLGIDHPRAAPVLADARAAAPDWTPAQQRALAADWIAPLAACHKAIDHARDRVFAEVTGHEAPQAELTQRWQALRTLSRTLGSTSPVPIPTPRPAHPEPVEGSPQRKAA